VSTEREVLVGAAYADGGPLEARRSLYDWQRPRIDLPALVVDALAPAHGTVADVGCGTGVYLRAVRAARPDLRVVGLDLSPGMRPDVVADAAALPLPDGGLGAALALHMLYHVPDVAAAVAELRRVVSPDGVVVVSTNGRDDKREIDDLVDGAVQDLLGAPAPAPSPGSRFVLEDAEPVLGRSFARVVVDRRTAQVVVPRPEPVVAFVESMRALREPELPPGVDWDDVVAQAARRVRDGIERDGSFAVSCVVGLAVASG
jgi:SAM-dependent methyltransferase